MAKKPKLLPCHVYRRPIFNDPYDKRWCAAGCHGERTSYWQCGRRPILEYGGHKWCRQHYPPNVKARKDARATKYKAENDKRDARWAREAAEEKLKDDALSAIRKIAAGHNDPVALARQVLSAERGTS